MKGLVYREFRLAKKNIIIIAFIVGLLLVIHNMILLSLDFGTLSKQSTESIIDISEFAGELYYVEFAVFMLAAFGIINNIFIDYRAGWMIFSKTLPGGIKTAVRARYISFILIGITEFALGFIISFVMAKMADKPLNASDCRLLLSVALIMNVIECLYMTLAYALKTSNKTIGLFASFLFLVMIFLSGCVVNEKENIIIEKVGKLVSYVNEHFSLIVLFAAVITCFVFFVCYEISLYSAKREGK